MLRKINLLAGLLSVVLFSNCSYRSNFVVHNNTKKTVIIELVCDSSYLPELILQHQIQKHSGKWAAADIDSLKQSLKNPETLVKYLKDSLLMLDLLESGDIRDMAIGDMTKIDPRNSPPCTDTVNCNDWGQSISSYYKSDSALINLLANTITLFLPANDIFYNRCHASGDCSCGVNETFPLFAKEMKIKIDGKNFVTLTPDNFIHIMKKQTFNSMKEGVVLELH
jgi:hypothetical protein